MLRDDFIEAARIEGQVESLRNFAADTWNKGLELKRDRKNRTLWGFGWLKMEILGKIRDGEHQYDGARNDIDKHRQELRALNERIARQQAGDPRFAEAVKLETIMASIQEHADAAWEAEKALEGDRNNRTLWGYGKLKKEIMSQIGESQYQRDCRYESINEYKAKLTAWRQRFVDQDTAETMDRSTAELVEGLGQSGTAVAISVRGPVRFKSRVAA